MGYNVKNIFFSPGGTTKVISEKMANSISDNVENIDLLRMNVDSGVVFSSDDILVVTMPVFSGRIPGICLEALNKLKGKNTPAIVAVSFGNRAYDDALLELVDLVKSNGFRVAGAGAFIARHSIFPHVAEGRPDSKDIEIIEKFAKDAFSIIESNAFKDVLVPGNKPYMEPGKVGIYPTGDEKCIECGTCVRICPVKAISIETPKETDREKCVVCTACIYNCPVKSRNFHSPKYKVGGEIFASKNAKYLEPEVFLFC